MYKSLIPRGLCLGKMQNISRGTDQKGHFTISVLILFDNHNLFQQMEDCFRASRSIGQSDKKSSYGSFHWYQWTYFYNLFFAVSILCVYESITAYERGKFWGSEDLRGKFLLLVHLWSSGKFFEFSHLK